jgi:hypothetical protein
MSFQNGVWTINDWTISEFWCINNISVNGMKNETSYLSSTFSAIKIG